MSVNEKMTAIADSIRAKTGKAGKLTLDDMPSAIESIKGGGDDSNYYTLENGVLAITPGG